MASLLAVLHNSGDKLSPNEQILLHLEHLQLEPGIYILQ